MREVCFLLVEDKILRAYFGSATRIPDERERWETIWERRSEITEIVHSHPGEFLGFSHEDLTTMEAVEAGTGKTFTWSIVTKTGFLSRTAGRDRPRADSPWWLGLLRELSYSQPGSAGILPARGTPFHTRGQDARAPRRRARKKSETQKRKEHIT